MDRAYAFGVVPKEDAPPGVASAAEAAGAETAACCTEPDPGAVVVWDCCPTTWAVPISKIAALKYTFAPSLISDSFIRCAVRLERDSHEGPRDHAIEDFAAL